jgi:hypothetical protein
MKAFKLLFLLLFMISLSSCVDDDEYDPEINGVPPVFQGMEVLDDTVLSSSFQLLSSTFKNMNIEDEIPSIDVPIQEDVIYFARPNEDVFVRVNLFNPDGQVILRIIVDGIIYQIAQFESGSNSETLILRVNAGNVSGIKTITIDEIKYIENVSNEIKDATFLADRTIKMGITYLNQIEVNVSNEILTPNSYEAVLDVIDPDNLTSIYNNPKVFYLFDGTSIIYTQSLTVGRNIIDYRFLHPDRSYEYAVASSYDLLDGSGTISYIALDKTILTPSLITLQADVITQESISFVIYDNDSNNVSSIVNYELYRNDVLILTQEILNDLSINTLLSDTLYQIKVNLSYDLNDDTGLQYLSYVIEQQTLSKETPTVSIIDVISSQDSISFELDIIDIDTVGEITTIDLYQGETFVESLSDLTIRTFHNLTSNSAYQIQVTYIYNLLDGLGIKELVSILDVITAFEPLKINDLSADTIEVLDDDYAQISILLDNPNAYYIYDLVVNNNKIENFELSNNASKITFSQVVSSKGVEEFLIEINQIDFVINGNVVSGYYDDTFIVIDVVQRLDVLNIRTTDDNYIFEQNSTNFLVNFEILLELYNPFNYDITSIGYKLNYWEQNPTIVTDINYDQNGMIIIQNTINGSGHFYFHIDSIEYSFNEKNFTINNQHPSIDNYARINSTWTRQLSVITVDNIIGISTIQDLKNMRNLSDYRLLNDIDLLNVPWTPLDLHTFSLDGNGFSITGLNINATLDDTSNQVDYFYGLFGKIEGYATIYDLTISGVVSIVDNDLINISQIYAGLLFGFASMIVMNNISVLGDITITGDSIQSGVLAGSIGNSSMNHITVEGKMNINSYSHAQIGSISAYTGIINLNHTTLFSSVDMNINYYVEWLNDSGELFAKIHNKYDFLTGESQALYYLNLNHTYNGNFQAILINS